MPIEIRGLSTRSNEIEGSVVYWASTEADADKLKLEENKIGVFTSGAFTC